jgi:hypothetical protein
MKRKLSSFFLKKIALDHFDTVILGYKTRALVPYQTRTNTSTVFLSFQSIDL